MQFNFRLYRCTQRVRDTEHHGATGAQQCTLAQFVQEQVHHACQEADHHDAAREVFHQFARLLLGGTRRPFRQARGNAFRGFDNVNVDTVHTDLAHTTGIEQPG